MRRENRNRELKRGGTAVKRFAAVLLCFILLFTNEGAALNVLASAYDASENALPGDVIEVSFTGGEVPELLTRIEPFEEEDEESVVTESVNDGASLSGVAEDAYWDKFSSSYFYDRMSAKEQKLYEKLYAYGNDLLTSKKDVEGKNTKGAGLELVYDSNGIRVAGLSKYEAIRVTRIFNYENPQYYFFYSVTYANDGTIYPTVYDEFADGADRAQATEAFKENIESWYADCKITAGMSDVQKEKQIHDLITERVIYDPRNNYSEAAVSRDQSSFSVLGDGRWNYRTSVADEGKIASVCAGFSQSFMLLCNYAGLETVAITSSGKGAHAWNKVRINGYWYITDLTWDNVDGGDTVYTFFNRSDEMMDELDNDERSHNERSVRCGNLYVWQEDTPPAYLDSSGSPYYEGVEKARHNTPEIFAESVTGKGEYEAVSAGGTDASVNMTVRVKKGSDVYLTSEGDILYYLCDEGQGEGMGALMTASDNSAAIKAGVKTLTEGRLQIDGPKKLLAVTDEDDRHNKSRLLEVHFLTADGAEVLGDLASFPEDMEYLAKKRFVDASSLTLTDVPSKKDGIWIAGFEDTVPYTGIPYVFPYEKQENGGPYIHIYSGTERLYPGKDVKISYKNNKNAGNAMLVIKGTGNNTGSLSVPFTITGSAMSELPTGDKLISKDAIFTGLDNSYAFTGLPIAPGIMLYEKYGEASLNGISAGEYIKAADKSIYDYVYVFSNNTNAGTAKLNIYGINRWKGTIKKSFKINSFDLGVLHSKEGVSRGHSLSVSCAESASYEKEGAKLSPVISDTCMGVKRYLTEGRDYRLKFKNNKAAGNEAVMYIVGRGDYKGEWIITYRVDKKDISDTVFIADSAGAKKKEGWKPAPVLYTYSGKKLSAGTDYDTEVSYSYEEGSLVYVKRGESFKSIWRDAGEEAWEEDIPSAGTVLKMKVYGTGNYTGSTEMTMTVCAISKDMVKASVSAYAKPYTGEAVKLSYSDIKKAVLSGSELSESSYNIMPGAYMRNNTKGNAMAVITGKNGYSGFKIVKFKIEKRRLKEYVSL